MATVPIQIDGRTIEAEDSLNLIEAARLLGIQIPHFCYHPGLGVDGNCRMCMVEVEGNPKPAIACNTFVRDLVTKDGVRKVFTTTPRVKELQKSVLEFLFLNHPLDCPICDQSGECLLQDYYMANGRYQSRLDTPKVHKRKVVQVGPRVVLDAERCVLCTRCVRFCDTVTGTGELYIVNRGNRSEITNYPGIPLDNDYSLNTVDICPVGALTSSEFRFRQRVWLLHSVHSICTGCARGCNIFLEHADGIVYRYRPRENMEVNRYWMCDPGRLTYHALNEDRCHSALLEGQEVPIFAAMKEAGDLLRAAREDQEGARVLILVSPASSTETLYAVKRFAAVVAPRARLAGAGTRAPGVEDKLLRRADPYPNRAGLRRLGLERDPEPELKQGGDLLLVVEDDPLGETQRPEWQPLFDGFGKVVYLGTNLNATSRAADLVLPLTPHSECDGTFVNFQDRLQRFRRGLVPQGDALWAPELLRRLAAAVGCEFGWVNLNQLWSDLSTREPGFVGVDVTRLGATGALLDGASHDGAAHGAEAGAQP
jgi:NADH-quinone oxidoreductase subunit G